MEKQFRAIQQIFNCFLFEILAQLRAIKWRKQPLRAIPPNGIPIGNPNYLLVVKNW